MAKTRTTENETCTEIQSNLVIRNREKEKPLKYGIVSWDPLWYFCNISIMVALMNLHEPFCQFCYQRVQPRPAGVRFHYSWVRLPEVQLYHEFSLHCLEFVRRKCPWISPSQSLESHCLLSLSASLRFLSMIDEIRPCSWMKSATITLNPSSSSSSSQVENAELASLPIFWMEQMLDQD